MKVLPAAILLWCSPLCQGQVLYPAPIFADTYLTVKSNPMKFNYIFHKKIAEIEKRTFATYDIELTSPDLKISCKNVLYTSTYMPQPVLSVNELASNFSTIDEFLKKEKITAPAAEKEILEKALKADGDCLGKALKADGKQWFYHVVHDPNIQIVVSLRAEEGGSEVAGSKSATNIYPIDELPETEPVPGATTTTTEESTNILDGLSLTSPKTILMIGFGAIIVLVLLAGGTIMYLSRMEKSTRQRPDVGRPSIHRRPSSIHRRQSSIHRRPQRRRRR